MPTFSNSPFLSAPPGQLDVLCFSHLRWDFVYQRPQHLLSRFSKQHRVFFIEEPIFDASAPRLEISAREHYLTVVVPHLPADAHAQAEELQRELLDGLLREARVEEFLVWCYSPMSLGIWEHLEPAVTVYDCMDELSLFRGAPPALCTRERQLMDRADVVFTGGQSLYEAKREQHANAHAFPSSIDFAHFASARQSSIEPADQTGIPHPRLGFFGVIDERFDRELLAQMAELRPDLQFVIIGPVAKIDPEELPRHCNIHYLGQKSYAELPAYIAHWDVALLLFARNDATRFISPTKTPEYLAAGKPVVSTSIRDVVRPYGDLGLVAIADEPQDFIAAIDRALEQKEHSAWRKEVDAFLADKSWDRTFERMQEEIEKVLNARSELWAQSVSAD